MQFFPHLARILPLLVLFRMEPVAVEQAHFDEGCIALHLFFISKPKHVFVFHNRFLSYRRVYFAWTQTLLTFRQRLCAHYALHVPT